MKSDDFFRSLLDNLYDGVYFVDEDRTITYWNKGAERITGFASDEVVGKRCSDNILIHIDREGTVLCRGICPLAATMEDGTLRSTEVYLHHKDGHRVPVSVRVAPLHDAQGAISGAVEIFSDSTPRLAALERIKEVERLAYLDPLTGLANRRYTEIVLAARQEEMRRYDWRFGVVFVDIDRFKNINDTHGHAVGDEVLKMVAKTLAGSIRSFDVIGRWGGEEFIGIIANIEPRQLVASADRFRVLVEQSALPGFPRLSVTISVGATLARPEDTVPSILERADALMYQSKTAGRNRVTADV